MTAEREENCVIVVSGLPRSGTSMLMKMFDAGGVPILTDAVRRADEDNPKGYYEFERVKKLKQDKDWLPEAAGKAVKVISHLLPELPEGYRYKVVFLHRAIEEVLASQRQMLIRRGEDAGAVADDRMAALYRKHLAKVEAWLAKQAHMDVIYLDHRAVIADPQAAADGLNGFLGGELDAAAMAAVVDPALHRQKR